MNIEMRFIALEERVAALEEKEQPHGEVTVAIDAQKFAGLLVNSFTRSTKGDIASES